MHQAAPSFASPAGPPRGGGGGGDHYRRDEAEDVEVERNLGEDAGPLHLDRHLPAVLLERGLVHLPSWEGRGAHHGVR